MGADNRNRMHIYIGQGFREQLRQASARCDLSMAAYVRRAIALQMKRDEEPVPVKPTWLAKPDSQGSPDD